MEVIMKRRVKKFAVLLLICSMIFSNLTYAEESEDISVEENVNISEENDTYSNEEDTSATEESFEATEEAEESTEESKEDSKDDNSIESTEECIEESTESSEENTDNDDSEVDNQNEAEKVEEPSEDTDEAPEENTNGVSENTSTTAEKELIKELGSYKVSAVGNIPDGAELSVKKLSKQQIKDAEEVISSQIPEEENFTAYDALDIEILKDGKVWQPVDSGENVNIEIKGIDFSKSNNEYGVTVYRVEDNGEEATLLTSQADEDEKKVEFDTEHFTQFVIGETTYETDDATESVQVGDNLTAYWYADTGTIVINGTGDMNDFTNDSPLYKEFTGVNRSQVKRVMLSDGITSIGSNAFYECTSLGGTLVLPESVTSIGRYAFYQCNFDGSLNLPSGITAIEEGTFQYCARFTGDLIIPNGVTSIGKDAFQGCNGFTGSLSIPDTVVSIGKGAFALCDGLTGDLVIPDGITSIEGGVFGNCSGFTGSLVLPDGLISIGDRAFVGCSRLTGNLSIPDTVTSIEEGAFSGCSGFTGNLVIPDGITSIEDNVFVGCSGFTGTISVPDGVTTIGSEAFRDCTGFTGISTLNNVTTIRYQAFYGCTGLTGTLTISDKVITIGEAAFEKCNQIEELVLPDSVTTIKNEAFMYCDNLQTIRGGNNVATIGEEYVFYVDYTVNTTLITESDTLRYYDWENDNRIIKITQWKVGDDILAIWDDTTKTITIDGVGGDYYSFDSDDPLFFTANTGEDNDIIEKVVIVDGITAIADNSFNGFLGLTSFSDVTIPESVISIGDDAFESCSNITGDLVIPDSITYIGNWAFMYCTGFDGELVLGNSLETIGNHAFYDCPYFSADNLVIPDSVITIGDYAFNPGGDSSYTFSNLVLGSSLESIGEAAFASAYDLTGDLVIPDSVTSIGEAAFDGCGFDGSLTLGTGLSSIANYVFRNNHFTGELIFPNNITEIGDGSFANIPELTTFSGGNNINSLGSSIFEVYDSVNTTVNTESASLNNYDWASDNRILASANTEMTFGGTTYNSSEADKSWKVGDNITAYWYEDINTIILYGTGDMYDFTSDTSLYANANGVSLSDIHKVYMSDEITHIGDYSFKGCRIQNADGHLAIPTDCVSIGDYAFYDCIGYLPDYSYSMTENDFVIPDSVVTIGDYAFGVTAPSKGSLILGSSLETIGDRAFTGQYTGYSYGRSFTGNIVIPDSVTSIGEKAFYGIGCTGTLTLGDGLITIGDEAFSYSKLRGDLVIPDNVTDIGDYAFSNSYFGNTLTLGSSLVNIGENAFKQGSGMGGFTGTLTIPDSVETIGNNAFYLNPVTTISGGSGLTSVGTNVFFVDNYTVPGKLKLPTTLNTESNLLKNYSWSGDNRLVPKNVELKAGESVLLDNEAVYYDTVAEGLGLNTSAVFVEVGTTTQVAGTLAFKSPTNHLGINDTAVEWKFTPTSDEYTLCEGTASITVNPATLTVVANAVSKIINKADPTLTYSVTGFKNNETSALATGNLTRAAGETAGTYAISKGTLAFGDNYSIDFTSANLTITAHNDIHQRVGSEVSLANNTLTYGDALSNLAFNACVMEDTDGDAVAGTIAWKTPTYVPNVNETTATWLFTPSDTDAYNTLEGNIGIVVNKAALTLTIDNKSKKVGSGDPVFTFSITGFKNGDAADTLKTGYLTRDTGEEIGTYAIKKGTLSYGNNYEISNVTNGVLTINDKTVPNLVLSEKTGVVFNYGEALSDHAIGSTVNYTATDPINGNPVAGTISWKTATTKPGVVNNTVTVVFTPNDTAEYKGVEGTVALTITPADIDVTIDNKVKALNDADPVFTYTATGFVNGDIADVLKEGALTRDVGETLGDYTIRIGTLAFGGNYTISNVTNGTLTIKELVTPVLTIGAIPDSTFTYGDSFSDHPISGLGVTLTARDETAGINVPGTFEWKTPTVKPSVATTNANVVFTPTDAGNYKSVEQAVSIKVNPKALTVVIANKSKNVGDADPAFTYTVTGFVNNETEATLKTGVLSRDAGEAAGNYAIKIGTLAFGNNYSVDNVTNGVLTINSTGKKTPIVTINGTPKKNYTYGDSLNKYNVEDAVDLTIKDSDTGANVVGSIIWNDPEYKPTVSDTQVGYKFTPSTPAYKDVEGTATIKVLPKGLTVVIDDIEKTEGEDDPTLTYSVSGFVNGDIGTYLKTGTIAREAGEAAGTYKIGVGSLSFGNNYAMSDITEGTLTIKKSGSSEDDPKDDDDKHKDNPSKNEIQEDSMSFGDPYSPVHNTDGSDIGTISSGNARYEFDEEKSNVLIFKVKADISKKFAFVVSNNEYVPTAKHRYTTSNKKLAKVNKKGIIKPKRAGVVEVQYEQKVKGGKWTKIGDPITFYIQRPTMEKKVTETIEVGEKLDAYKYLTKTTYSPTTWVSTKPSVAVVDESGVITVMGKGKTSIVAVYSNGRYSSKKRFKTKLTI